MSDNTTYRSIYVMAAKGIQGFILRGDKLRLMIGGSELIEALPEALLRRLLGEIGLEDGRDYQFLTQAAGSARILFVEEEGAKELATLLPCALSLYAPGIEAVQAIASMESGFANALLDVEKQLQASRNMLYPSFPLAGPLVDRCPRSGLPVTGWFRQGKGKEPADASMVAKDKASTAAGARLAMKVLPACAWDKSNHPCKPLADDFDKMVCNEGGRIAVVHIDGNGLGELVMKTVSGLRSLPDYEAAETYRTFSDAIENATKSSMQTALEPIVARSNEDPDATMYPFRPLVCAGDDVTLVMRAADAMSFVERFLTVFESETRKLFEVSAVGPLQGMSLTAGAGIVYINKSFPFAQAYSLCESLCGYAKDKAQRKVSAVAFWRQTTAVANSFEEIVRKELTTPEAVLTMMPYRAGEATNGHLAGVRDLMALRDVLLALPKGSMRGVLNDLYRSKDRALQSLARIGEVSRSRTERDRSAHSPYHNLLDTLGRVTGGKGEQALFRPPGPQCSVPVTPLYDALELIAAERG